MFNYVTFLVDQQFEEENWNRLRTIPDKERNYEKCFCPFKGCYNTLKVLQTCMCCLYCNVENSIICGYNQEDVLREGSRNEFGKKTHDYMRINENFSFQDENEMWKYWNTHTPSDYAVIDVVKSATQHNYIIPLNREIDQGMADEHHYYCIIQKEMKRVNQEIQQFASSPMSGGSRRAGP
jgi:hypothetical protein